MVLSILNQVLGHDNGKFVDEVMLCFLMKFNQIQSKSKSGQVSCFKIDEFLAKVIHAWLVNFHTLKNFKYQA